MNVRRGLREVEMGGDLLVDSIVHQQLCEDGGQEGSGDAQAEATAGAVERPPQAQRQRR